jgi:hypothetical protein
MFRTSYVLHQEDFIVLAVLCYVCHALMQAGWQGGGCDRAPTARLLA